MDEQKLITSLYEIRDRWNKEPHLSNDHAEGMKYGEIRDLLLSKFDIEACIYLLPLERQTKDVLYEVSIQPGKAKQVGTP